MKNNIYIGVALAISLFSCQKEDSTLTIDPNAIRVSARIGDNVASRSNPNGDDEAKRTGFNDGDAISIQVVGQDATTYALSGTTWTPAADYLLWRSDAMVFSAFHPITTGTSTTTFSLPIDQSDALKIASADYMKVENSSQNKSDGAINLAFLRQTARVIVTIKNFDTSISDLEVSSLTINSGVGEINGSTVLVITPLIVGDGAVNTTYTALVLPTSAKSDESFITLQVGSDELIVKGIPFHEAGKSYSYDLTVGRAKVVISSVKIAEWGTGKTISEDAEKDPVVPTIDLNKLPLIQIHDIESEDYTHSIYVFDRNAGVNVPSVQDTPVALNWVNDGTDKITPDANYAFKGDYYTWDQLFTGVGSAEDKYGLIESIVNETTNPCHLMGDGWRVPSTLEIMYMCEKPLITLTNENGAELTGEKGVKCYFPLSGAIMENDLTTSVMPAGAYWTSSVEAYGDQILRYPLLLDSEEIGLGELTGLDGNHGMSVRCVKTAPPIVSDL